MGIFLRARQFAAAVQQVDSGSCREYARRRLDPSLWPLFAAMEPVDQVHACRVARDVARAGWDGPIAAGSALLHDAGKSCGAARPSLVDRVVLVLGRHLPAGMFVGIAGWTGAGLSAALHHPAIGARCLRERRADPYLVWLVANHERRDIHDDPLLSALIAADDALPTAR
jgi:hypothetical protein